MLNAAVGVSAARAKALTAEGQAVPALVNIRALIDTGASCTCVDPSVLVALGIPATGTATMNTASSGQTPHVTEQFDVALAIPGATATDQPLVIQAIPVVAIELLAAQNFHALIGRDILSRCLFFYNGAMGHFSVAF
ncbi:MAG: aspartyl protease family protein [Vicinamibacterales bacterium]